MNFDDESREKFGQELESEQHGPAFEVIGRVLKATSKRKVGAAFVDANHALTLHFRSLRLQ